MKRLLLLLSLAILLGTSCVSGRRMMRAVPFGESSLGEISGDRINLWPLLYNNNDITAVLWPIMDFDSDGFAVRPLVAADGQDWSFAFPLAGWHFGDNEGWIGPFYHFNDNTGLFPVMNFGPDLSFIGPFWENDGFDEFGIFPVAGHFGDFSHIGPFWQNDGFDEFGLFPIAGHHEDCTYIGPAWWDNDFDRFGLFPLAGKFEEWGHVGPVWWADDDVFGFFPLFNRFEDFYNVGPVWWKGSDCFGLFPIASKIEDFYHLGPLWMDTNRPSGGLFPFVYWRKGSRFWAFPLYGYSNRGTKTKHRLLFGALGGATSYADKERSSSWLTPIWFASKNGEKSSKTLLPVFHYSKNGDTKFVVTPFGGRGWTTDGDTRMMNVLGPLFHRADDGEGTTFTSVAWPFWMQKDEPNDKKMRMMFPLFYYTQDGDKKTLITPLGGGGSNGEDEGGMVNILGPVFIRSTGKDSSYTSVMWPFYRHKRRGKNSNWTLFPLATGYDTPESAKVSTLFGLFSTYKREGDRSRFSFLKYAYRRERDGDKINRDIFPFIQWDSGPDEKKVSFLWRLFNYQRKGAMRGGHVLFIPWGIRE